VASLFNPYSQNQNEQDLERIRDRYSTLVETSRSSGVVRDANVFKAVIVQVEARIQQIRSKASQTGD